MSKIRTSGQNPNLDIFDKLQKSLKDDDDNDNSQIKKKQKRTYIKKHIKKVPVPPNRRLRLKPLPEFENGTDCNDELDALMSFTSKSSVSIEQTQSIPTMLEENEYQKELNNINEDMILEDDPQQQHQNLKYKTAAVVVADSGVDDKTIIPSSKSISKGHFIGKVCDIVALIRYFEFLKNFHNLTLIFEPNGLCSCGYNDDWSYVYEAYLHKSFFKEFHSNDTIEMSSNVDVMCKTIKDMKKNFHPSQIVLEKKGTDLLIRDNDYINERRVISMPYVNSKLPIELENRIRSIVYDHHVTIPAANLCKTLERVISSDIKRITLTYYENSHLRISWEEQFLRNPCGRFPIIQGDITSQTQHENKKESNSSNWSNMLKVESETIPVYKNIFNRRYISYVCRANVNYYVRFSFPVMKLEQQTSGFIKPQDKYSELPIMIKMKIHQENQNPSNESSLRMWVAPCK